MLHGWVEPEDVPLLVQILAQALLQAQLRIPYKKNYIIQGEPHAGKSTFINFITQVLGNDVVTHKSLQSLCNDRFVAADLEGKLLNAFDELQEIPLENVGQFKALVGSCYHGIERKFQQSYSGIITCPHIFSCNRPPKYPEEVKYDTAFWERWEYVRFPFSYLIDDAFVSKISSGLMYSSFLNLVIAAMIQIRKDRHLTVNRNPEEVMDRWSLESDPLCQFIRVKMTENSNASETSNFDRKKLFEIYQRYCQDESIEPRKRIPTMNKFTRDLQKYKLTPSRTSKRIGGRKETIDIYVGPYRWNGLQQEIEPEVNGLESLG
jgi:phage/plasmid-associated DNA primase